MQHAVTVIADFKLAPGKTEQELIAASDQFQQAFVNQQSGVLRRELIKTGEGCYTDIVQFRSREDAEQVMAAETTSEHCLDFFSVMDMSDMDDKVSYYPSLATYTGTT